jgi:hypothetical protein
MLEAWLGPMPLYLIFAATTLIILGLIFRQLLSGLLACFIRKKREQK